MSTQALVQVTRVDQAATSKGTIFKLIDANGVEYTTFKADIGNIAAGYAGKQASITYTEKQNGQYTNRYLDSIEPVKVDPVAARAPDGVNADWDQIGLRKTRCALWAAYLRSPLAGHVAARVPEGQAAAPAVFQAGRSLVEQAEWDIYVRANPDPGIDPSVPF